MRVTRPLSESIVRVYSSVDPKGTGQRLGEVLHVSASHADGGGGPSGEGGGGDGVGEGGGVEGGGGEGHGGQGGGEGGGGEGGGGDGGGEGGDGVEGDAGVDGTVPASSGSSPMMSAPPGLIVTSPPGLT